MADQKLELSEYESKPTMEQIEIHNTNLTMSQNFSMEQNEWLCHYLSTDKVLLNVGNKNTDPISYDQIVSAYQVLMAKWNVSKIQCQIHIRRVIAGRVPICAMCMCIACVPG